MKAQFWPEFLDVEVVGPDRFANKEPLEFIRPNGERVLVPVLVRGDKRLGFVHDGGSIPLIFAWLVGDRTSLAFRAFVIHDFLYVHQTVSRAVADRILLEGMEAVNVNPIRRRLIWGAVRAAGWTVWNSHPPLNTAEVTAERPGKHWRVIEERMELRIHEWQETQGLIARMREWMKGRTEQTA